jgi:pyridoxal phosphate enzyme (YggS family)
MSYYTDFLKNFETAVLQSKRHLEEIELIAVSKRQSIDNILSVINEGQMSFGENQLQEINKKWPLIKDVNQKLKLHFIGSIQSKKLQNIINHCDVIHTIDREKLIQIISKLDKDTLLGKSFFIQINTGNESQKSGINLNYAEEFFQLCRNQNINIDGLMCLPPENEEPDKHFEILQSLANNNHIKNLSMGMSNDYAVAIKYGSTHIRVGSAIFGNRN